MEYEFGHTTFQKSVFIKAGQLFSNPSRVMIDLNTRGVLALEVLDAGNSVVSRGQYPKEQTGWHTFDFRSGAMNPPVKAGLYKLRIVNLSQQKQEVHGGSVNYDE